VYFRNISKLVLVFV